jgi:hypothetical protein
VHHHCIHFYESASVAREQLEREQLLTATGFGQKGCALFRYEQQQNSVCAASLHSNCASWQVEQQIKIKDSHSQAHRIVLRCIQPRKNVSLPEVGFKSLRFTSKQRSEEDY